MPLRLCLHCQCAREENIVFEVDMLMQVLLEIGQCGVERAKTGAGVEGRSVVVAGRAEGSQGGARAIVLLLHHSHRIGGRAERGWKNGLALEDGFFHALDVGEQDVLLFH